MKFKHLIPVVVLSFGITFTLPSKADVIDDWGTITTPLTEEVSFSFAQYDITKNFTDHYLFSLEGEAGASYSVSFNIDSCDKGCGNPDINYGIYHANGSLITTTDGSGSITLETGNYLFQVKGTGMGSGNDVDYWGSVTFAMVSPVSEPSTLLLSLPGFALVGWMIRRRRSATTNATDADPSYANVTAQSA
jgi:hypothetical protein